MDGVVFPMPMSPVPIMRVPSAARSRAIAAPLRMQSTACSRLMAGARRMLAVPAPTLASITAPDATRAERSARHPMSTTRTPMPAWRLRTLMPARPAANPWTIWPVTSDGYALTPSATTP